MLKLLQCTKLTASTFLLDKCCSAFPRKFYVADSEGNAILEGVETSSWCGRLCAESCHGFELDFRDADGVTVLSMEKTAACPTFYCCNAPVSQMDFILVLHPTAKQNFLLLIMGRHLNNTFVQ